MKFDSDKKSSWKRKIFNEDVLKDLSDRERAEFETNRDLQKPIEQLLCDVHEETHNSKRNELANIASAQKRMVSMMARVAISNEKTNRKMLTLTVIIVMLTVVILALTYLMWHSQK